jgi:tetratricopeptide (TPR) repeat protein
MLSMLGAGQYRAQRRWLAIRSCDEAIERFRALAAERPAFRLEIAELLPRLGELLAQVHEHERALETFEEWVALADELGGVNAQTPGRGEIAEVLRHYAESLEAFGRTEEARRCVELADRLAPAEA